MTDAERNELWDKINAETQRIEQEAQSRGILFRGWRFWPPYGCGRCGRRITARQFGFARICGGCDHGDSKTARLSPYDPRWFIIGPVQLEDPKAAGLINPMFLSAALKYQFGRPRNHRHLPKRPVPRKWDHIRLRNLQRSGVR